MAIETRSTDEEKDYSPYIRHLAGIPPQLRIPLTPYYAHLAIQVVRRSYPPRDSDGVFRMVAALNLLNAIIKQPMGRHIVSYQFIKGYASLVFTHVARCQTPGVSIYWDARERIAYFRIYGVQMGFHHIPITLELSELLPTANTHVQRWDGLRLQTVAVELFLLANPESMSDETTDEDEKPAFESPLPVYLSPLTSLHSHPSTFNPPSSHLYPPSSHLHSHPSLLQASHQKKRRTPSSKNFKCTFKTLQTALHFSLTDNDTVRLYRRKDRRPMSLVRYNGENYAELIAELTKNHPAVYHRREDTLTIGKFYYLSPQMHIESVPPSHHVILLAQNSYLCDADGHSYHNLCVSYGIARYLTACYPPLRFINLLNFNRRRVASRYYSHNDLRRVPLNSPSRRLKVWMPVDPQHLLSSLDITMLPKVLVGDYLKTKDYYKEFELTWHNGLVGLYAYHRHHLLKPIYRHIYVHNYHAQVMRTDGKMAIYGLNEERFKTDFIYDDIWYNQNDFTIYGITDSHINTICALHPEEPFP